MHIAAPTGPLSIRDRRPSVLACGALSAVSRGLPWFGSRSGNVFGGGGWLRGGGGGGFDCGLWGDVPRAGSSVD